MTKYLAKNCGVTESFSLCIKVILLQAFPQFWQEKQSQNRLLDFRLADIHKITIVMKLQKSLLYHTEWV